MTTSAIERRVRRALRRHANRDRAEFMTGGYAPSRLRCIGTTVPEMRAVGRAVARELKGAPARDVVAVAKALAAHGSIEERQIGYELIGRRPDAMAILTPALVRALGRGNDNWASVDGFATHLAGPAWRLGRVSDAEVCRWAASKDPWWRRTALVATVALNLPSRGGTGDTRRTLMICERLTDDDEPSVAKALSWALRALIPRDAGAVRRFLSRHPRLPSAVRREVWTKLTTGRKTAPARAAGRRLRPVYTSAGDSL